MQEVSTQQLTVGVYRRLDNRLQGEPEDSDLAWELHRRRRRALEDAFAADSGLQVLDWGDTRDEERTHEFVELLIAAGGAALHYVVAPAAKALADKLIQEGVDRSTSALVKAIFSRLRPKQEDNEIQNVLITLPDGTRIDARPPDQGSAIVIDTPSGRVEISRAQQIA